MGSPAPVAPPGASRMPLLASTICKVWYAAVLIVAASFSTKGKRPVLESIQSARVSCPSRVMSVWSRFARPWSGRVLKKFGGGGGGGGGGAGSCTLKVYG